MATEAVHGAAIAPSVIAAGSVTVGVIVGKFLDSFGERRRWRRDQRMTAYAQFIAAADVLMVECGQDPTEHTRERCYDGFSELARAGAAVDVFGDRGVAETTHELFNLVRDWLDDWEAFIALPDEVWNVKAAEYRVCLVAVVNAARLDLRSPTFAPRPTA